MTNMKKVKNLSVAVCTIIFTISLLIDNVFTLEKVANAFYKYGTLVLVFGVFTLVLIGANIKKKMLQKRQNINYKE